MRCWSANYAPLKQCLIHYNGRLLIQTGKNNRATFRRVNIKLSSHAPHGAQTVARCATGRVTIGETFAEVAHSWAAIDGRDIHGKWSAAVNSLKMNLAAPRMPHEIGCQFGDDYRRFATIRLVETG